MVPGHMRPSIIPPCNASGSGPSNTSANRAARLANGGSGHADATNASPKRAAAVSHLRDHAVRLRNRRGRHCLRRCCDGKGKASNSYQSDHSSPPLRVDANEEPRAATYKMPAGIAKASPRVMEALVRLHYLISPASGSIAVLVLLLYPFDFTFSVVWLPLAAGPY